MPIKGVEHPPLDPLALHAVFDSLQGRGGSARNGPSTILRMVPLPIECNGEDHTFASLRLCVNQISYPAQFRYPPRHANPYRRASFFFARPSGRAVFLYQNRVPCGPSRRICAKPGQAQQALRSPADPPQASPKCLANPRDSRSSAGLRKINLFPSLLFWLIEFAPGPLTGGSPDATLDYKGVCPCVCC